VRYADDFVVLARYIGTPITEFLESWLEGKMDLKINRAKTRILNLKDPGERLDFLGYSFRLDRDLMGRDTRYLNQFPSPKAVSHCQGKVRQVTRCGYKEPLRVVIPELNRSLLSWARYFRKGYPSKTFRAMDAFVLVRMERFLRNRSQRRMHVPKGMSLYGWMREQGLVRLSDPATLSYLRGEGTSPVSG